MIGSHSLGIIASQRGGDLVFDAEWMLQPGAVWQDDGATIQASPSDPIGRIDDASGHGRHVTQSVSAEKPTLGDDAGILHIVPDGSDDRLFGPSLDGLGFPYTLAAWLKPSAAARGLIVMTHYVQNQYTGVVLQVLDDLRVVARIGNGVDAGSESRRSYISDNPLSTGAWQFCLAEFRGYDDVDIYIDNTPQTYTISGTAASASFSGGVIALCGEYNDAQGFSFSPHKQALTFIYRGVLSAAERQSIYDAGPSGTGP